MKLLVVLIFTTFLTIFVQANMFKDMMSAGSKVVKSSKDKIVKNIKLPIL